MTPKQPHKTLLAALATLATGLALAASPPPEKVTQDMPAGDVTSKRTCWFTAVDPKPQSTRPPRGPEIRDVRWIDLVPKMIQPTPPLPPGWPELPKPLYDRVEEFDAIILVTKLDSRVLEVRDGLFCAVTRVRADEVLKGDKSKQGRNLDIACHRWDDRALLEKLFISDVGPGKGIVGLKSLPDGAPMDYVQLWFHVPDGEDWEPVLERFRSNNSVLNFDGLGLPNQTVITDQYADDGVIFSAPGGDAVLATASFPIFPLEPQGLYSNAGDRPFFVGPLVADIADGASMVGVWIDFGATVGTGMKIEAFDGSGGTGQLLGSDSTTSETFISVSALTIRSVVISQVNDADATTYLIDNFTFEPPACFETCPADIDNDGTVGILDLLNLLAAWGPCP